MFSNREGIRVRGQWLKALEQNSSMQERMGKAISEITSGSIQDTGEGEAISGRDGRRNPERKKGGEVHGPVSEHAKRKKVTTCSMPGVG